MDVVGSERAETSRNIEHWTRVRGDFGCDFGGNRRVGGLRVERNARGRVGGGRAWGQGNLIARSLTANRGIRTVVETACSRALGQRYGEA